MAAKKPIGHMTCPLCDLPDGEVKEDKNGNPCFFCPDCTCQILTHGREPKASHMLNKMRPVIEGDQPTSVIVEDIDKDTPPSDPEPPKKSSAYMM